MDKHNGPMIRKVFIQRDYSQGTGIRFQSKFPQKIDEHVSSDCDVVLKKTHSYVYLIIDKR